MVNVNTQYNEIDERKIKYITTAFNNANDCIA